MFHPIYLEGLVTRSYGVSLGAIRFLEELTEETLPKKRNYVEDIRAIVEHAIAVDYASRTGIPIDRIDREDMERKSPHYAMYRKFTKSIERMLDSYLEIVNLEKMLWINLPDDKK